MISYEYKLMVDKLQYKFSTKDRLEIFLSTLFKYCDNRKLLFDSIIKSSLKDKPKETSRRSINLVYSMFGDVYDPDKLLIKDTVVK